MARIAQLKPEELSEHQMRLAKSIGGTRGGDLAVNGPWGLLLRNPVLCEKAAEVGTMLRDGTSVPKRLSELAIAVVARHWTAQFEWWAHAPQGLRAGLSKDVIEAIRLKRTPSFDKPDEAAVYAYVKELLEKKKVSEPTYQALHKAIGTNGAIELTAIAGFYSLVAMLIVGLDVPLREGVTEPPLPE
jgi:4-carboxymuconolactone decarboxylase